MKRIIIFFVLLLVTLQVTLAQQIQVQDSPPDWAFMLSNLNTTQITSGILYNKTAMFCNLYDYNRGKYNDSHADHFKQAISELHYASEQTRFISAQQLKTNTANTPTGARLSTTLVLDCIEYLLTFRKQIVAFATRLTKTEAIMKPLFFYSIVFLKSIYLK